MAEEGRSAGNLRARPRPRAPPPAPASGPRLPVPSFPGLAGGRRRLRAADGQTGGRVGAST